MTVIVSVRFVDALSDPLPLGPEDHVASSTDLTEEITANHNFYICPMCSAQCSNLNLAEFESHVNSHFD